MKLRLAIVGAALLLASCMNTQVTTNTAYACATATALLNTATAINATLTADDRTKITHAVSIINPICSAATPPTLDSVAQAALSAALLELTTAVQ